METESAKCLPKGDKCNVVGARNKCREQIHRHKTGEILKLY
jgi:hypothetical protein